MMMIRSRELRVVRFLCVALMSTFTWQKVVGSSQFPAMFVFGDSLIDNGNNNLLNSLAKANYLPYGIDFYGRPTGRFCNGKTIIDFLGDLFEIPPLPSFTSGSRDILNGVNYASAAAGILDESGQNLGDRFTFTQQVLNFGRTLAQLKSQMDEEKLSQYLAKSLVVLNFGSNDYIQNYLLPELYPTSFTYNPQAFANLLIKHYISQTLELQDLGFRKFLVAGVGPIGCMPNLRAKGLSLPGKCVSFVNDLVELFNRELVSAIDQLNKNFTGSNFVYWNTYKAFNDVLIDPISHGFRVTDTGCCGIGRNRGMITCLPYSIPCFNREEYVFWDAYHPTQAFNQIIAKRLYLGSYSHPISVKQMAL